MMDKTLDKLKELSDYTDGAKTEDKDTEFTGEIIVVNKENGGDYEIIPVYLKTPKNKVISNNFLETLLQFPLFQKIFTFINQLIL